MPPAFRGTVQALLCATLALVGGCADQTLPDEPVAELTTSFESGLDGWTPAATDIELGDDTIDWHVQRSTLRAAAGSASAEVYLNNLNDAAKVWITRPVQLQPGRRYVVDIELQLGTRDWGEVNPFSVIAGAVSSAPSTHTDLEPALTGDPAGHGQGPDAGYVWLRKHYRSEVTAGPDGRIYPVIGIWGMYEVGRTYYLDELEVRVYEN